VALVEALHSDLGSHDVDVGLGGLGHGVTWPGTALPSVMLPRLRVAQSHSNE
jgi:hypothetical protein